MKTKNILTKIIYVMVLVLGLSACKKERGSFLDPTDVGNIDEQTTFADSVLTFRFVAGIYTGMATTYYLDNGITGGGLWSFSDASDDSENRWSGATAQAAPAINSATFSGAADFSRFKNHWTNCYNNIRRVNVFLANVDRSPISANRKAELKLEVRFLRAYYYWHLLRNYGGIPLLGDKVYTLTDDFALPRSSFDATVKYIIGELDACAALPVTTRTEDFGRPTKGAAMGLKSKVLLFAASPLFNGQNPGAGANKPLIGYENEDANRWKAAADAAKAVMDMGIYSLVLDNTTAKGYGYYQMQISRNSTEHIFQIMKPVNRWYEGMLLPVTRGGQVYASPTQSLVDAYPMNNGKLINETGSGYSEQNMYTNRDPRFYYSILYDGSTWLDKTTNTKTVVNLYAGAASDGLGGSDATKTGYLFRKFCNEGAGGNYGVNSDIALVAIRYGEILLNYAEALNEFSGPTTEVYQAVEKIRERAGLVPYQLATGLTKDQMRDVIRNERRVELVYEEATRFYDIKRWKIAENVINGPAYGMRRTKNGNVTTGARFSFETRIFTSPKMYYFPIPQSEMNKSSVLIQNPGW